VGKTNYPFQVAIVELTKVRAREHFGMVTSDTSTGEFSFLVSPIKNRTGIGKGDYVTLDHPLLGDSCPLLAVVKEIKRYEEVIGASLGDRIGKMVATADIIGYVDLREEIRPLRRLLLPPYPGSRIYLPFAEFLEDIFSRDLDGKFFEQPVHLGKSDSWATSSNENLKQAGFFLDAKDFTKHHFLISAMDGAGKTNTATVIVEELANKTKHPIVILDPYDEYSTIGVAGGLFKKLAEEGGVPIESYPFNFSVSILAANPDRIAKGLTANKIKFGENQRISIREVSTHFGGIPSERTEREVKELMARIGRKDQVTVINSSGFGLEEKCNFFMFFVKSLLKERFEEKVEPFLFVIEDAEILTGDELEIIASEGNKVGISMGLLSKHPTDLGARVLSQMGTQIVGRTTDANDMEYLRNMVVDKSALLPQLRTGEFIVNGFNVRNPIKVILRERYSSET
jgi:DNA helicase HerA-like ATPase